MGIPATIPMEGELELELLFASLGSETSLAPAAILENVGLDDEAVLGNELDKMDVLGDALEDEVGNVLNELLGGEVDEILGELLGNVEGASTGFSDGELLMNTDGVCVGKKVGEAVGLPLGMSDGKML